ncbi:MAG: aminoacetone oxidase family FAD-binding enzyme [Clostridia bacterium]|nr:aminoacetone oxidase family FAD-binding enzyme [Clostridia bacterium]
MMKKVTTTIIGGGFSGMICAAFIEKEHGEVLLLERLDRLGKKLSATGNGQGNLTNVNFGSAHYFTQTLGERDKIEKILSNATDKSLVQFFEKLGGLFSADERGRVYPTGRQASSLTDLLRYHLNAGKTQISLSSKVTDIKHDGKYFILTVETDQNQEQIYSENVVICTGGKAAKNFGTDGNGYLLAKSFSHTVTPLYPALVQLKTDARKTKSLKGIRVMNAKVSAYEGERLLKTTRGDLIFTEYGVSGDAIFKLSSYVTQLTEKNSVTLCVDLLPEISEEILHTTLLEKSKNTSLNRQELLCGILNNQIGRLIMKESEDVKKIVENVKKFPIKVTGTLGFDYAQVTKGGIPLSEVNEQLESKRQKGLYFAGEVLDVDGECGGYNLQWAFSSAVAVAESLNNKHKPRGQV